MRKLALLTAFSAVLFLGTANAATLYYTDGSNRLTVKDDGDSSNGTTLGSTARGYPTVSPDGSTIVYVKNSNSQMYQKSASDSSDGTNICSDTVASPQYSPDGNYIYYINASHGSVIYKKNANDSLCGSAITSASSLAGSLGGRIAVSPDGTQIVYTKNSDGKLYQKSSTDSLDGSAITSDQGNSATYSPDGSYIYYVNASHSTRIYKKNSNDTANGTQITTQGAIWPSVSPDGNSLIYTQNAGSFLIYKTSGASDGSAINSQFSFYTTYASNLSAPGSTPVTSTQNGMTCTTNQIPDISAVSWNNFGGIGTYSTISNSSTNPDTPDIGVVRSDSATLSRDIFAGFGFQSGSTVDTGSIVYPGTGTSALYWPNNPDPENPPFLGVLSYRGAAKYQWNILQFANTTGTPFEGIWGKLKVTTSNGVSNTLSMYSSGGISTKRLINGLTADYFQIQAPYSGFDGFRMGKAPLIPKTECTSSNGNVCSWQSIGSSLVCAGTPLGGGISGGNCGVATSGTLSGACVPLVDSGGTILPPPVIPGQTQIYDGSGNVINTGYSTPAGQTSLFSCSYTGLDTFLCPFQIAGRIWQNFVSFIKSMGDLLSGISTLGSNRGTGRLMGYLIPTTYAEDLGKNLPAYWLTDGSGNVLPDQAPSYTGADMANLNHSMFTAGDNAKNMPRGGIKGVWAFSYWYLVLVLTMFVLTIIGMSFVKKDNPF